MLLLLLLLGRRGVEGEVHDRYIHGEAKRHTEHSFTVTHFSVYIYQQILHLMHFWPPRLRSVGVMPITG